MALCYASIQTDSADVMAMLFFCSASLIYEIASREADAFALLSSLDAKSKERVCWLTEDLRCFR